MQDLLSLLPAELEALLISVGEPKYRAGQMFPQLHKGLSPDEMTNVGKVTRKKLSEVAHVYRFGFMKRLHYVYYPQVRPYLLSAMSNALGFAWKAGVAAEVICGLNHTIGQNLADAKSNLEMDLLFGWTMTVVLLSLLFEYLFKSVISRRTKKGGVTV